MSIENLTIKEAKEKIEEYKELLTMFNMSEDVVESNNMDEGYTDKYVIVRTYSAGVWFGKILQKSNNEVILGEARRMYYWKAKQSISLSAVAKYGLSTESRICPEVEKVWLQPIELIDCTSNVINEIRDFKETEQR